MTSFYKLEASGNDFVIFIDVDYKTINISKLANRNYGIGADGIIFIDSFYNVKIFNADGSDALMCGNGMRCLCKLLSFLTNSNEHLVYINNREISLTKVNDDEYRVEMPVPFFVKKDDGYFIHSLNNHIVYLKKNIDNVEFTDKDIELSRNEKANIHYVSLIDKNNFKIKTYEYGVGKTKACGTGSIASFFTLLMLNKLDDEANAIQDGGIIKCSIKNNKYFLEGNANLIYKGEIY